uniref:ephrin-A2-like isoform X2 n=1 Tax=Myxine glutinosa TaxID=7769 RepID=UPI00358F39A2
MGAPCRRSQPRLHVCRSSAGFPVAPICCLIAALVLLTSGPGGSTAEHFVVFWNRSNTSFSKMVPGGAAPMVKILSIGPRIAEKKIHTRRIMPTCRIMTSYLRLLRSDYTLRVHINDYLDIYCPYYSNEAFYSESGDSSSSLSNQERYILHMVNHTQFLACDAHKGFVRWNCDRPGAPGSGLKFSEKFHLITPFSAGFEFRPGHEYYYMSTPVEQAEDGSKRCFRLRISVCCPTIEGRQASHGTRNGATKIRHSQWTQLATLVLTVASSVTLHV